MENAHPLALPPSSKKTKLADDIKQDKVNDSKKKREREMVKARECKFWIKGEMNSATARIYDIKFTICPIHKREKAIL